MNKTIERNYLEINSLSELRETKNFFKDYFIEIVQPADFQLNKLFYKNVGKKHSWVDRLVWTEKEWIKYVSDIKVKTYVLKNGADFVGYFELILHNEIKEVEIAYLGLLEEYHNKKLGSFLLSSAIRKSFEAKPKRVWVHTCSLDHKNALKNYISRGMKVYKRETISL